MHQRIDASRHRCINVNPRLQPINANVNVNNANVSVNVNVNININVGVNVNVSVNININVDASMHRCINDVDASIASMLNLGLT